MRFTGFTIDGFGIFCDAELRDLPPGLTVLTGSNEAGKSTSLAFFRQMLFGFPTARDREQSYPPLAGGNHGGRLYIASRQLGDLVLQREKGPHGGRLTVTLPDGSTGSTANLQQLLGGVTGPVFRNVYAFSLSELQTFDSLSEDSVAGVIYAAATGAGALALPAAEKSLEKRMADLFAPAAKKPQVNSLLAELDDVRKRLRQAQGELADYAQHRQQLSDVEATTDALEEEAREAAARNGKLERTLNAWESWVDLVRVRGEQEELPVLPDGFPDDGLERFRATQSQLKATNDTLEELSKRREAREKELAERSVDERLLAAAGDVRDLASRTAACRDALDRQSSLTHQADAMERQISDLIRGLGPDWDEQRALAVDLSVFSRDAVRQHDKALRKTTQNHSDAKRNHELAGRQADAAKTHATEAREALATLTNRLEALPADVLSTLRNQRDAFAGAVRDCPDLESALAGERERLTGALRDIHRDLTFEAAGKIISARRDLLAEARKAEAELAQTHQQATQAHQKQAITQARSDDLARRVKDLEAQLEAMPSPRFTDLDEGLDWRRDLRKLRQLSSVTEAMSRAASAPTVDTQAHALARFIRVLGYAGLVLALASGVALVLAQQATAGVVILLVVGGAACAATWTPARIARLLAGSPTTEPQEPGPDAGAAHGQDDTPKKQVETLLTRLGLAEHDLSRLAELEEEATEALEQTRDRQSVEKRLEETRQQCTDVEAELDTAADETRRLDELIAALMKRWHKRLAEIGLPSSDVSPANLPGLVDRLAACVEQGRNTEQLTSRFEAAQKLLAQYRELCSALPDLAEFEAVPAGELLVRVDDFLAAFQDDVRRRPELEKSQAAATAVWEKVRKAHTCTAGELEEAENAAEEATAAWTAWLTQNRLPKELVPETALEALATVDTARERIRQRGQTARQLKACRDTVEAFKTLATDLFARLEMAVPEVSDLPAAVLQLQERLDQHQSESARCQELIRGLAQIDEDLDAAQTRAERLQSEVQALFEASGVEDGNEDAFLSLARANTRHAELRAEEQQAGTALRRIMGEPDLRKLENELDQIEHSALAPELEQLKGRRDSLEKELTDRRQTRADLQAELRRVASADDVSQLRYHEEALSEDIRSLAEEWTTLAVTRELLDRAKQHFEQDQQPAILRDATRFFKVFTADAYEQVIAPLGERGTLEVVDGGGRRRTAAQLSRGTAEQLYLAIRFGYVRNHAANRDPLPVVMDDILVNFDPVRAAAAAQAIAELSQTHQVLFFTCHPAIAEMLCEHVPGSRQVTMEDSTFHLEAPAKPHA